MILATNIVTADTDDEWMAIKNAFNLADAYLLDDANKKATLVIPITVQNGAVITQVT